MSTYSPPRNYKFRRGQKCAAIQSETLLNFTMEFEIRLRLKAFRANGASIVHLKERLHPVYLIDFVEMPFHHIFYYDGVGKI